MKNIIYYKCQRSAVRRVNTFACDFYQRASSAKILASYLNAWKNLYRLNYCSFQLQVIKISPIEYVFLGNFYACPYVITFRLRECEFKQFDNFKIHRIWMPFTHSMHLCKFPSIKMLFLVIDNSLKSVFAMSSIWICVEFVNL